MGLDKNSFSLEKKRINISSIVVSNPKKTSRRESYKGLTGIVKEIGVLTPIHVMVTEQFQDAIDAGQEDSYTGPRYTLLDGFRRLYAATRNNIETIEAVVWSFDDLEKGTDISLILSLLLDRSQKHTWAETWNMMRVLEMQASMTPGVLETLLALEGGQAMKLRDIAMDGNHPDVWDELASGKKDLEQAYKALQKARKEDDELELADNAGIAEYGEAGELAGDATQGSGQLTDEDARELLEMNGDESEEGMNFGEFSEDEALGIGNGELQSTSERKPLDPVLRDALLRRDDYTCQVCGLGAGILSSTVKSVLEGHHTAGVYTQLDSSRDDLGTITEDSDVPKLLLVDTTCHSLIHAVAIQDGRLGITKEEFAAMEEYEQAKWKNIAKYAKVLLWAEKKSGHKMKRDGGALRREPKKPFWEISKENQDAEIIGKQVEEAGRNY